MSVGALLLALLVLLSTVGFNGSVGAIPISTMKKIRGISKQGPYLGLVVPNAFEMNPLLQSNSFVPDKKIAYLDFAGRRFRFGQLKKERVIIVMTGLSMLNAGVTTQLLLTLFDVTAVVHFGVAGNANPDLQIGDVTIPLYWAHTGLWNWQRYGDGPNDELALESSGDYTRDIGFLNFSDYSVTTKNEKPSGNFLDYELSRKLEVVRMTKPVGNYLNSVWYQPEEIFPVNGVPEERQHAFWVPVDQGYYELSEKLEGMELEKCVNSTTCLPRSPMVVRVKRGCSANAFVDNAAYRTFLHSKFSVTPIDMETAAVALVCKQQGTRFIAIRALSDLAGGGSALSNEASVFAALAAQNAVDAAIQFISLLP